MKTIAPDETYIDYFQSLYALPKGLNRFGIRVGEGRCFVVVKIGDGQPDKSGRNYLLPVQVETLPIHVRVIVDDHLLNHPTSDLSDVLTGRKSFREALYSQPEGNV